MGNMNPMKNRNIPFGDINSMSYNDRTAKRYPVTKPSMSGVTVNGRLLDARISKTNSGWTL